MAELAACCELRRFLSALVPGPPSAYRIPILIDSPPERLDKMTSHSILRPSRIGLQYYKEDRTEDRWLHTRWNCSSSLYLTIPMVRIYRSLVGRGMVIIGGARIEPCFPLKTRAALILTIGICRRWPFGRLHPDGSKVLCAGSPSDLGGSGHRVVRKSYRRVAHGLRVALEIA